MNCSRCGKSVLWVELPAGGRIALQHYPSNEGQRYRVYERRDMMPIAVRTRSASGHRVHEEICSGQAT